MNRQIKNHLLFFGDVADMIRRATPRKTDLIRPAGVPGRRTGLLNHGTPTLGQG